MVGGLNWVWEWALVWDGFWLWLWLWDKFDLGKSFDCGFVRGTS